MSAEIFAGLGKVDILFVVFRLLTIQIDTMQMDVHITLYPFCNTKKMPHVAATLPQMRFVGSSASFSTV